MMRVLLEEQALTREVERLKTALAAAERERDEALEALRTTGCRTCKGHPGQVPTRQAVQGWGPCPQCAEPWVRSALRAALAPATEEEAKEAAWSYVSFNAGTVSSMRVAIDAFITSRREDLR